MLTGVHTAVAAIRARRPVILPTDTVYGLCAWPFRPEPVERIYRLKGRDRSKPIALLTGDLDSLLEALPELDVTLTEGLLPGPYTLIVPNPAVAHRRERGRDRHPSAGAAGGDRRCPRRGRRRCGDECECRRRAEPPPRRRDPGGDPERVRRRRRHR
jgi:hypothetical protein